MTGRDAIRGVAVGVLAALVAATSAEAAMKVAKPTGSASVNAGDPLAVKVVVTNPSKKKAKAGQVTIKLSAVKLGALKVKALKGRQKATVTGSLTVPAGDRRGHLQADRVLRDEVRDGREREGHAPRGAERPFARARGAGRACRDPGPRQREPPARADGHARPRQSEPDAGPDPGRPEGRRAAAGPGRRDLGL